MAYNPVRSLFTLARPQKAFDSSCGLNARALFSTIPSIARSTSSCLAPARPHAHTTVAHCLGHHSFGVSRIDAAGRAALSNGLLPTMDFALGTTGVRDVDVA